MRKWKEFFSRHGADLILLTGAGAIALGAGMIFLPVGFIAGGVLAIAWWVLDSLDWNGEGL